MSLIIFEGNATLKKLDPDSIDTDKEGYVALGNLKVNIQPASSEQIALSSLGENEKLYQGFTTMSGIKNGMQIVTSGTITISGMTLVVRGAKEYDGPLGVSVELLLGRPK